LHADPSSDELGSLIACLGCGVSPDRLISLSLLLRRAKQHPFTTRLWERDVSRGDVERLPLVDMDKALLCFEGVPPADHIALMTALTHVLRQTAKQWSEIKRSFQPPEFNGYVPRLDSPSLPYALLLEHDLAV
jgi:hypothetical protein